jgi:hypothetical protein
MFMKAVLTFKFQRVFCPKRDQLVFLHDLEGHDYEDEMNKLEDNTFLGSHIEDDIAKRIVKGEIDPNTHEEFKLEGYLKLAVTEATIDNSHKQKAGPSHRSGSQDRP